MNEKTCPYCAETVLTAAVKCKHCGSMLDGSARDVTVRGVDPSARLHTPIQGMKAGSLTPVGWCGIGLGGLLVLVSAVMLFGDQGTAEEIFFTFMCGVAFGIVSFLWARKK